MSKLDLRWLHHPQDRREFRREAARLRTAGLNPAQIATALRISPTVARELLTEHGEQLEFKSGAERDLADFRWPVRKRHQPKEPNP